MSDKENLNKKQNEILLKQNEILLNKNKKREKGIIWLLYLSLGWSYGYFGQILKQILYYLTVGGLGIWTIILLFTLNRKIKEFQNDENF